MFNHSLLLPPIHQTEGIFRRPINDSRFKNSEELETVKKNLGKMQYTLNIENLNHYSLDTANVFSVRGDFEEK